MTQRTRINNLKMTQILNQSQIDLFLNGNLKYKKQLSKTRIIEKTWPGAKNINFNDFNYIVLPDGRIDINLPNTLVEQIIDIDPKTTCNLLINPAKNKNIQDWHQDNAQKGAKYITTLIALNDKEGMIQTEFKEGTIKLKPGYGVTYNGSVWHRGRENLSNENRYVIYFVTSEGNIDEKWKI